MTGQNVIVVGVDGSPGGRRALDWAMAEVLRDGGTIRAVTAWSWDGIEDGPLAATSPVEQRLRAERLVQREVSAALARAAGPVSVSTEAVQLTPVEALTAAAESARLLVLGSHGHSAVRHRVLGSVSDACIRRAACPVVVVPVPVPVTQASPA